MNCTILKIVWRTPWTTGETKSSVNNCWTDSFMATALRLWNKRKDFTCSSCCSWMLITTDYEVLLTFVGSEITWPRFYISLFPFQKSRFEKQFSVCDILRICNLHKRMGNSIDSFRHYIFLVGSFTVHSLFCSCIHMLKMYEVLHMQGQ